jgi:murein DD-endopeptidase MepM/ murein hydrolase activator NlpD
MSPLPPAVAPRLALRGPGRRFSFAVVATAVVSSISVGVLSPSPSFAAGPPGPAVSAAVPTRPADPPGGAPSPAYIPPIDAPVTDPFRPPSTPYGPGNRGIEYATVPGTPVVAAADGVVSFAGQVAGSLYVTVQHPDGVRITASFLATIAVVAGAPVVQGQVIGTTGGRLHISARRGDVYFDPASLWGSGPPRVYLVPLDGGPAQHGRGRPHRRTPPFGWGNLKAVGL